MSHLLKRSVCGLSVLTVTGSSESKNGEDVMIHGYIVYLMICFFTAVHSICFAIGGNCCSVTGKLQVLINMKCNL